MATNDCLPVCFDGICNNAFYFRGPEEDEDVDEDDFQKSPLSPKSCWIKNNSKFLVFSEKQFKAKDFSTSTKSECQFHIQTYNFVPKTTEDKTEGTSVMLYINTNGKTVVACCNESEVHPVEMNLPLTIDKDQHEAVFFLKQIPSDSAKYTFESSTNKEKFLAFEADESDPNKSDSNIFKLVLRNKADEVDIQYEDSNS